MEGKGGKKREGRGSVCIKASHSMYSALNVCTFFFFTDSRTVDTGRKVNQCISCTLLGSVITCMTINPLARRLLLSHIELLQVSQTKVSTRNCSYSPRIFKLLHA